MFADPDKTLLLEAVAAFLESDARAAISDPRVSFRTLIAAHLCRGVAAELKSAETREQAELARLTALLSSTGEAKDTPPPKDSESRRKALAHLDRVLIRRIRANKLDAQAQRELMDHLKQTLRDELSLSNPRFDLSPSIE